MKLDSRQCQAVLAVIDSGSFEQAATLLHLTPSAVSQRVRALEESIGSPLVARTRPCRPTPAGRRLMQHLRQVRSLEEELQAEFTGDEEAPLRVTLAVNADTLGSWLLPALAPCLLQENILLDLSVDDQEHTYALLEAGLALGCIAAEDKPMRGCTVEPLGKMRYRCMASPAFRERWFARGMTRAAVGKAPLIAFNRKDRLPAEFLRKHYGMEEGSYPCHFIPASESYMQAIALGLGWGVVPEIQMHELHADGALIDIAPQRPIDVGLYWHVWKVQSPRMERLSHRLVREARRLLA